MADEQSYQPPPYQSTSYSETGDQQQLPFTIWDVLYFPLKIIKLLPDVFSKVIYFLQRIYK